MTALASVPPMAKASKPTTKVDPLLLKRARHVAIHRGIDLYDYLDGILRPVVERDFAQYAQAIHEETKQRGKKLPAKPDQAGAGED